MALSVEKQIKYWGIVACLLILILWFFGNVLLPFILGAVVAYFLNPVAEKLESRGLSRAAATGAITLTLVLILIAVALLVIPAFISQATSLFESGPDLANSFSNWLSKTFPALFNEYSTLQSLISSSGDVIKQTGGDIVKTALNSVASVMDIIMLFIIAPVVAVYLLLDWKRLTRSIDELLPREHAPVIRSLMKKTDHKLSGFIRGTGTVCLILGVYYSISLMLVGLQFGLVVGLAAGLISFIPYLGAILGGALAMGLALFQFWNDWVSIALVLGIFVFGQAIEGNFITPKLVGNSVGLHPVWLIMSLSVFGSAFGFLGLLVAVPIAAILGVLTHFFKNKYKQSTLYTGNDK